MLKKKGSIASRRKRRQQGGGGLIPLLFFSIIMVAFVQWQVAVLFMFFLSPTWVLSITSGKDPLHPVKLGTVAFMNLAGILPFAVDIWERPTRFQYIILDMVNIATMLGAAAIGYGLLWLGPYLVAQFKQAMAQDRLKAIAQQRQQFLELYGPEVLADLNQKPANEKKPGM